jgi:hypothetical protein
MMGKKSRIKGQRNECAIVNLLKDAGLPAERVPLSGAAGGQFAGDILIDGKRYEAKIRASGFRQIYEWLGDHAGLFIRSDRRETLIVIRAADFIELMTKGKRSTRAEVDQLEQQIFEVLAEDNPASNDQA